MQGSMISRSVMVFVVVAAVIGVASAVSAGQQGAVRAAKFLRVPAMVGLVMDGRGYAYTASRQTGDVFCLPPASEPVLLARLEGTPSVLAADRLRNVFVGTEEGTIYCVSLDGSVTEAYRCSACPVGMAVDRDGGLVVALEGGSIVRVQRRQFFRK